MFQEESNITIVEITEEIPVVGLNLQGSGLPITFQSLGMMWERYTKEQKENTPNKAPKQVEYGICLNKVPDYIVGVEVTFVSEELKGYYSYTIPAGTYVKAWFSAQDHDTLVGDLFTKMQKRAFLWIKEQKLKCNRTYTVEVYPLDTKEEDGCEMYFLIPILK